MKTCLPVALALFCLFSTPSLAADFPSGWLPIQELKETPTWSEVREDKEHIHLYLPDGDKPVDGVFICFVFHSSDPRELANLWNFAMVTVPWQFIYDLGHNDKRSGRYELGHEMQDTGLLLKYLEHAAKEKKHPELTTVPIVGWLGQNGSHLLADLHSRAPERILAWGDSFPNRLRQYPEMTEQVPFAFAWEISKKELREGERAFKNGDDPKQDLSCRANTYGFDHGIYSKYNFFVAYIDRCIAVRMPDKMPPPGEPVKLKPVQREAGWLGDFNPISQWNPIAKATDKAAADYAYPSWFPDEYAAHMWRSYHSANPELNLTGPVVEYRKKDGKWGGPECGLGYGGELASTKAYLFTASAKTDFEKVEFCSGNQVLGTAQWTDAGWHLPEVKLAPGLHAFFAVGTKADGTQSASRPAFAIVK